MTVQNACFFLADISGYTRYLSDTELEHAQDILSDLLETVVTGTKGSFEVNKIEGDAVFCLGEPSGPQLVATIESCFFAFHQRADSIEILSSCECAACRTAPQLDLKFVIHHGEYSTHQVAGGTELVGPEVVTAHRLLKNTISERLGADGYAFFTDACLDACGLDAAKLGWDQHTESFDDVGEISGAVANLTRRWDDEKASRRVRVDDGMIEVKQEVAAAPSVAWEWATNPAHRAKWQIGTTRVDSDAPSGVIGVGTHNHCVHGRSAFDQQVLDWKPFEYLTYSSTTPAGPCLITMDFEPTDHDSTIVTVRSQGSGGRVQQLALKAVKRGFRRRLGADLASLAHLVETEKQRT